MHEGKYESGETVILNCLLSAQQNCGKSFNWLGKQQTKASRLCTVLRHQTRDRVVSAWNILLASDLKGQENYWTYISQLYSFSWLLKNDIKMRITHLENDLVHVCELTNLVSGSPGKVIFSRSKSLAVEVSCLFTISSTLHRNAQMPLMPSKPQNNWNSQHYKSVGFTIQITTKRIEPLLYLHMACNSPTNAEVCPPPDLDGPQFKSDAPVCPPSPATGLLQLLQFNGSCNVNNSNISFSLNPCVSFVHLWISSRAMQSSPLWGVPSEASPSSASSPNTPNRRSDCSWRAVVGLQKYEDSRQHPGADWMHSGGTDTAGTLRIWSRLKKSPLRGAKETTLCGRWVEESESDALVLWCNAFVGIFQGAQNWNCFLKLFWGGNHQTETGKTFHCWGGSHKSPIAAGLPHTLPWYDSWCVLLVCWIGGLMYIDCFVVCLVRLWPFTVLELNFLGFKLLGLCPVAVVFVWFTNFNVSKMLDCVA